MNPWKPSKDAPYIMLVIIVGLLLLHGCAPIHQSAHESIEADYLAKIGKLKYEIDELRTELKEIEWRESINNDYQDDKILNIQDKLRAHEESKWPHNSK